MKLDNNILFLFNAKKLRFQIKSLNFDIEFEFNYFRKTFFFDISCLVFKVD